MQPARAPSYIRLFAATTPGNIAAAMALEWCKSMLRVLPVRVIPCDGAGVWKGYDSLLTTPTDGTFVNVVACGPESWSRTHRYEVAPKADPVLGMPASSSWDIDPSCRPSDVRQVPKKAAEVVIERFDYWTKDVRNVLFAAAPPRDQWQLAAAKKFDQVVVPTNHSLYYWRRSGFADTVTRTVPVPVIVESDHALVRAAILGAA